MGRPVFDRTMSSRPLAFSSSHMAEVRRHCQTTALNTGRPDARSHTMVVSRWLVMPMARSWSGRMPVCVSNSATVASHEPNSSSGSCSTQPGCG